MPNHQTRHKNYKENLHGRELKRTKIGLDANRLGEKISQKEAEKKQRLAALLNQGKALPPEALLYLSLAGLSVYLLSDQAAGQIISQPSQRRLPQSPHINHHFGAHPAAANRQPLPADLISRALQVGGLSFVEQLTHPSDPFKLSEFTSYPLSSSFYNQQSGANPAPYSIPDGLDVISVEHLALYEAISNGNYEEAWKVIDKFGDLEFDIQGTRYTPLALLVEKSLQVNANSQEGRKIRELFIRIVERGIDPTLQPSLPAEIINDSFLGKRYTKILAEKSEIELRKKQQDEQQRFNEYMENHYFTTEFAFPLDANYFGYEKDGHSFALYSPTDKHAKQSVAMYVPDEFRKLFIEITKVKPDFNKVKSLVKSGMSMPILFNGESLLFAVRHVEILDIIAKNVQVESYSPLDQANETPLCRLLYNSYIMNAVFALRLESIPRYLYVMSDFAGEEIKSPKAVRRHCLIEAGRAKLLINRYFELGASPNEVNAIGHSIIFDALETEILIFKITKYDIKLLELFIQYGTNLNVLDINGKSILEFLIEKYQRDKERLAANQLILKEFSALNEIYYSKIKLVIEQGAKITSLNTDNRKTLQDILALNANYQYDKNIQSVIINALKFSVPSMFFMLLGAVCYKVLNGFAEYLWLVIKRPTTEDASCLDANQGQTKIKSESARKSNHRRRDRKNQIHLSDQGKDSLTSAVAKEDSLIKLRIDALKKVEAEIITFMTTIKAECKILMISIGKVRESIGNVKKYSNVKEYIEQQLFLLRANIPNAHKLLDIERHVQEMTAKETEKNEAQVGESSITSQPEKEKTFNDAIISQLDSISRCVNKASSSNPIFYLSSDSALYLIANDNNYDDMMLDLQRKCENLGAIKINLNNYKNNLNVMLEDIAQRNRDIEKEKNNFNKELNIYRSKKSQDDKPNSGSDLNKIITKQRKKPQEEKQLKEEAEKKQKKEEKKLKIAEDKRQRKEQEVKQQAETERRICIEKEEWQKRIKANEAKRRELYEEKQLQEFLRTLEKNPEIYSLFYSEKGYQQILNHTDGCLQVVKEIFNEIDELYLTHRQCSELDNRESWIERVEFYGLIYALTRASDFLRLLEAKRMLQHSTIRLAFISTAGKIRNNLMHNGFLLRKETLGLYLNPYANILVNSVESRVHKIKSGKSNEVTAFDLSPYDNLDLSKSISPNNQVTNLKCILNDITRYLDDLLLFSADIQAMPKNKRDVGFYQAGGFQYAIKGVLQLLAQRLKDFNLYCKDHYETFDKYLNDISRSFIVTIKKARDDIGHIHGEEVGGDDPSHKLAVFEEVSETILIESCENAIFFKESFDKFVNEYGYKLQENNTVYVACPDKNSIFNLVNKPTIVAQQQMNFSKNWLPEKPLLYRK